MRFALTALAVLVTALAADAQTFRVNGGPPLPADGSYQYVEIDDNDWYVSANVRKQSGGVVVSYDAMFFGPGQSSAITLEVAAPGFAAVGPGTFSSTGYAALMLPGTVTVSTGIAPGYLFTSPAWVNSGYLFGWSFNPPAVRYVAAGPYSHTTRAAISFSTGFGYCYGAGFQAFKAGP